MREIPTGHVRLLLAHDRRIEHAKSKRDQRPHIPQERIQHIAIALLEILLRQRDGHAIFADFREQTGKSIGAEVVKLNDVEKEGLAVPLSVILAAKGGVQDGRDD